MLRFRIFCCMLAVATLAALGGFIWSQQRAEIASDLPFPENLPVRISLPEHGVGEIRRVLRYDPGGNYPIEAAVDFADGETGVVYFRSDGTVREYRRFFIAADDRAPVLKIVARLDASGRRWTYERHYRADGSLAVAGNRLPSGQYQLDQLFEDGITLAASKVFSNVGTLLSNREHWRDGSLKLAFSIPGPGRTLIETFYEGGVRKSVFRSHGNTKEGESYWPDGETLQRQFKKTTRADPSGWASYWVVNTSYFSGDGSLDHMRFFEYDHMRVELEVEGVGKVVQRWVMLDQSRPEATRLLPDNFKLDRVTLENFNGHDRVEYAMVDAGSVVMEERYRSTIDAEEVRVVRFIRADGTVEKIEARNNESNLVLARSFTGDDGGTVILPASVLVQLTYDPPPAVADDPIFPEL